MFYKKWLFVPAKEKFLSGRASLRADALIYDLEDSIRPEEKPAARERLCKRLSERAEKEVYVRINSGAPGLEDLRCLKDCQIHGFVLPKIDDGECIQQYAGLSGTRKLIALVESVSGVKNLEAIASSPLLYGLAFGGEDYCRELGVETNDLAMQYPRGRMVLLARYYGKYCLDTISLEYRDSAVFRKQFLDSISMGFHSKLLIHPAQVETVCGLEETVDLAEMREIVRQYEESSEGLVCINGRWYEKPHIDRLKAIINQMEEDSDA